VIFNEQEKFLKKKNWHIFLRMTKTIMMMMIFRVNNKQMKQYKWLNLIQSSRVFHCIVYLCVSQQICQINVLFILSWTLVRLWFRPIVFWRFIFLLCTINLYIFFFCLYKSGGDVDKKFLLLFFFCMRKTSHWILIMFSNINK